MKQIVVDERFSKERLNKCFNGIYLQDAPQEEYSIKRSLGSGK